MALRNSKIILCNNIRLDRVYKNVLNYNQQQMLKLCQQNMVASKDTYSFIPGLDNTISVGFTLNECLNANYIAYQNPKYSNKWFFAFIDSVKYINDGDVRITYTIDVWSTFFGDLNIEKSFVIREHTNNDTAGNNTEPENVELGEYISYGSEYDQELTTNLKIMLQVSETIDGTGLAGTNLGGVWAPGGFYVLDARTFLSVVQAYQGKADAIKNAYVLPAKIIAHTGEDARYDGISTPVLYDKAISKPTTIQGYTPKNKKLFTAPYCYMLLHNNNGVSNELHYELWEGNNALFVIQGVPVAGGSIRCIPVSYGGESLSYQNSIICGKFPTLGWVNDPYINWLTQNAVNIGLGLASSGMTIVGGLALASTGAGALTGLSSVVSGGMGIAQSIGQMYQHSIIPNSFAGNTNGGDVNACSNTNTFYFIKMSIKSEYARIIDEYFTRFGYKTNRLKVPNITGRRYWNYIQIANEDDFAWASIQHDYLEQINQIARNGVTIWHDHNSIGDYSLNNTII